MPARHRLIFSPDGDTLFLVESTSFQAWSIRDHSMLYHQNEYWIGLSRGGWYVLSQGRDSQTLESGFIRYSRMDDVIYLRESLTGQEIDLETVAPDKFVYDQRRVTEIATDRDEYGDVYLSGLRYWDVLGADRSRYTISAVGVDNWAMTDDGSIIAVTCSGSAYGHDWAEGQCMDQDGNRLFDFPVNRFAYTPIVYISSEHSMLVVNTSATRLTAYLLPSGKSIGHRKISNTGGDFVCISPANDRSMIFNDAFNSLKIISRDGHTRVLRTQEKLLACAVEPTSDTLAVLVQNNNDTTGSELQIRLYQFSTLTVLTSLDVN